MLFDDVEIIVDQIVGTSFFAVTPRPPMTVLARARMTAPGAVLDWIEQEEINPKIKVKGRRQHESRLLIQNAR